MNSAKKLLSLLFFTSEKERWEFYTGKNQLYKNKIKRQKMFIRKILLYLRLTKYSRIINTTYIGVFILKSNYVSLDVNLN